MNRVILVTNKNKDVDFLVAKRVIKKLSSLGFEIMIDRELMNLKGEKVVFYDELPENAFLIIVIGGDGSIIDASRLAIKLDLPILGINLGKVGYLSEVEPDCLDLLERLKTNEFSIENKMLLTADKYSVSGELECSSRDAVNDVVISHDAYLGIAEFKLENSYGDRISYRADGVILSTPAGSTAYSLSAGGPIISHDLEAITVTPVCPHSFFNRSVIYGKDEKIKIFNSGETVLNVSVDGRLFVNLSLGEWCVVKKSETRLKMLTFSENNMFNVLFKKIKTMNVTN